MEWNYGYSQEEYVNFDDLRGATITSISRDDYEIQFVTAEGYTYRMYHDQDCCEDVFIESIVGDLNDLIGSEILVAEESSSNSEVDGAPTGLHQPMSEYDESFTWTFYKLATVKGYVDIRWYGTSNGYYSESVSLVKAKTHAVD